MATLALGALASAIVPASVAGTTLFGSFTIGSAIKLGVSLVGGIVDRALFSPKPPDIEGPRASSDAITSSVNGQVITRLYGTAAFGAHILYASRYVETRTKEKVGGKGGPKQTQITYSYTIDISYALAERLNAVDVLWFDGKPRPLADFTTTLYTGTGNTVDPIIEGIEGADNTTPYKGLAHLMFSDMDLTTHFSNRPPSLRVVGTRTLPASTLPELLRQILADDGITLDVAAVPAKTIRGAAFTGIDSPRGRFTQVAAPRLIDIVEGAQGALRAIPRYGAPVAVYDWQSLPVGSDGLLPLTIRRAGPARLPGRVSITAPDPDRDYENNPTPDLTADDGDVVNFTTPEPMTESRRVALSHAARADAIARRVQITGALPPRALLDGVDVGDIIALTDKDGATYNAQLVRMSYAGAIAFEAETVLPVDPEIEPGEDSPGYGSRAPVAPGAVSAVAATFMVLPYDGTVPNPLGLYVGVYANPWYTMAVWRERIGGAGAEFDLVATVDKPAQMGTISGSVVLNPVDGAYPSATLTVTVTPGALSSVTLSELQSNFVNVIAVECTDGSFEPLKFQTASFTGTSGGLETYDLTYLVRPYRGSAKTVLDGGKVVILDSAIVPVDARESDLGVSRSYRIGPATRDVSDPSYITVAFTLTEDGVAPLPPTNLAAVLDGGVVKITWTPTAPFGFDLPTEFEVGIYDGATLLRTFTVTGQAQFWYSAAWQEVDFGAALVTSDTLTVSVASTRAGITGRAVQGTFTL